MSLAEQTSVNAASYGAPVPPGEVTYTRPTINMLYPPAPRKAKAVPNSEFTACSAEIKPLPAPSTTNPDGTPTVYARSLVGLSADEIAKIEKYVAAHVGPITRGICGACRAPGW